MLQPEGISDFIQKNRKFLFILGLLIIMIFAFFFYYMVNTTSDDINKVMGIYHGLINNYIEERVSQTANFSQLSGQELDKLLPKYDHIYSWFKVSNKGNINYSYRHPDLGISVYEHSIFQEARESKEPRVYILPFFVDENEAVLAVSYPQAQGVNIAVFSFDSLLSSLPDLEEFRVCSYEEGNVILTNKTDDNFDSIIDSGVNNSLSLSNSSFTVSQNITSTNKEIYVVYDISPLVEKLMYFAVVVLAVLLVLYIFFQYARRNSRDILQDISELRAVSSQLSSTLEETDSIPEDVENLPQTLNAEKLDLNPNRVYSPEMKSVVNSYQQMMGEIHKLVHRISLQNEEISAMNDSLSSSLAELKEYQDKLDTFFQFFNNIDPEKSLEEFMQEILEMLLTLIPAGEAGSIGIIDNDSFRYLAQKGYDDLLKEIEFPKDIIFITEEPKIYREMHKKYHLEMPEEYVKIFKKVGSPDIKASLAVGLKTDEIIGNIFIDSVSDNQAFNDEDKKMLSAVSRVISLYIYLKISKDDLRQAYLDMIKALVEAVEIKDKYTKGHSERVAEYSVRLGKLLDLSEDRLRLLREAAILHDVGKIGISDGILNKAGPLTPSEYSRIKEHSKLGGKLLKNVENLRGLARIVRYHHERWDGTGYPEGLIGEEIPLESRIIAIFDAFDTILTSRAYKDTLSFQFALKELRENSGTQFDPHLIEVLLDDISQDWLEK